MTKYKVLSTKKLDISLVEQAKENDIEITEQEFISVKPILSKKKFDEIMPGIISEDQNDIVFTSSNGVEAVTPYLHQGDTWYIPNWNVYCLSGKTKDSLHPFISPSRIIATADNATGLANKIIEQRVKELIFFCGNKRRNELPSLLKKAGITVQEIIVYETVEIQTIATEEIDGILFFSPGAVQSFFSINSLNKDTVCFAIGTTTAGAIADFTTNKIIVSESPSQEMMLASVKFYFENKDCYSSDADRNL